MTEHEPLIGRRTGAPLVFGVVHLLPLPGSPEGASDGSAAVERAVRDATTLAQGGVDAVIVENLGDAPYCKGAVPPVTVAGMTLAAQAIRQALPDLPLGINVLRNDAEAALSIAAVVGARFIRVNVLTGAMVTDQGVIEGQARQVAQLRRTLCPAVQVLADVHVKHASPLAPRPLDQSARDTWTRGGADGLIVTGSATGEATDTHDLSVVRRACPDAPLLIGSGVSPDHLSSWVPLVDGMIVGTWFHHDGDLRAPVDVARVRQITQAVRRQVSTPT